MHNQTVIYLTRYRGLKHSLSKPRASMEVQRHSLLTLEIVVAHTFDPICTEGDSCWYY